MSVETYLSRARLRRDAPAAALRDLLVPKGESARTVAGHRLVWTLFADSPDRTRDFLWREAEPGLFYILSRRIPVDRHGLFELQEAKPFQPVLSPGDRLAFSLRANATIARGSATGTRSKPCDIVMDALYRIPTEQRGEARKAAMEREGVAWLARQGERAGFSLASVDGRGDTVPGDGHARAGGGPAVRVLGHRTLRVDRAGAPARLGVLDLEGVLVVCDPEQFVGAITQGFGRAKAFGCGLMLVRRA
ncbi:MAG TPA: type I-E CRISPR-associated protein Cas6/Cse3/CasE [Gemmatimonadaceae bacterium]